MLRHLYVHIPFCHHICPYCGFYKHTPGKLANRLFVDALLAEGRIERERFGCCVRQYLFRRRNTQLIEADSIYKGFAKG